MEKPWSPWTLRFFTSSKLQTRCREQIFRAWPTGVAATLMWLEARSNARRSVDGPSSANGHAIPAHRGGCGGGRRHPLRGSSPSPRHPPCQSYQEAVRTQEPASASSGGAGAMPASTTSIHRLPPGVGVGGASRPGPARREFPCAWPPRAQ